MKIIKISLLFISSAILASCTTPKKGKEFYEERLSVMEADAMSLVGNANGSQLEGRAVFVVVGDPADQVVGMAIKVRNIAAGKHALHMHEFGQCDRDAAAAGGHWNPTKQNHGQRGGDKPFHKGDITNLVAGEDKNAFWFGEIKGWTIGGDEATNILNKSLVIHAGPDDFVSQPGGDAGPRVGCGRVDSSIAAIEDMKKSKTPFF